MAKRPKKNQKSRTKTKGLVTAVFVKDIEQAKDYEALLKIDDIPTIIKEQKESEFDNDKGFAVMVPEEFLDEAYAVIESQNAYDDFYDFALEGENESDLESDFFEDDF